MGSDYLKEQELEAFLLQDLRSCFLEWTYLLWDFQFLSAAFPQKKAFPSFLL